MSLNMKGVFPPVFTERYTEDRLGFIIVVRRQLIKLEQVDSNKIPVGAPSFMGVPLVRTEAEASPEAGVATVRHYYEGLQTDRPEAAIYEIDGSFDEVPLQAHPDFKLLFKKFGGYYTSNGNLRWATSDADDPSGNGLTTTTAADGKTLAGIEGWLRMGAVVRSIQSHRRFPADAFQGIGIISQPQFPDGFLPTLPGKRNYLKAPPRARYRGNAWEVTREWILSGIGGWMTDIYNGNTESDEST